MDDASAASAAGPGGATSTPSVANRKLKGYVGFANLPNQVHKRSIKKGFDFTILVVGTFLFSSSYIRGGASDKDATYMHTQVQTQTHTPNTHTF